jgi:lipopolysaccharide/colanic/teichoic acid biosynthesis glycosyltransferase
LHRYCRGKFGYRPEDIPVANLEYRRTISPPLRPKMSDRDFDEVVGGVSEIARERSLRRDRSRRSAGKRVTRPGPTQAAAVEKHVLRRVFDTVCASAGLVFLVPLFAMIALAIKLDDGGPVLYSQFRVGKGLRRFRLLKFRSMFSNCAGGSLLTAPRDARVTRVGRFLRRYKLDELPQLVNVLRGEMQLVGARPQVERFVDIFRDEYEELLQSPPGITDLASLSFRNEERLFQESSIEEHYIAIILPIKLKMALKYSRTRTFLSDLEILFRTVLGFPSPSTAWREARVDPAVQSNQSSFREILHKPSA